MGTRTVQFLGFSVGPSPANVTATFNGATVFSGPVTTNVTSVPSPIVVQNSQILFTCTTDNSVSGNIPMTLTVQSGTVHLGDVLANYANLGLSLSATIDGMFYANVRNFTGNLLQEYLVGNIEGNSNTYISSGSTFYAINNNPEVDVRHDQVYIDGNLVSVSRPPVGTWSYVVEAGETLTCNVEVVAGLDANITVPIHIV